MLCPLLFLKIPPSFYVEEGVLSAFLGTNLLYFMLLMKFSRLTELFIYNVESRVTCLLALSPALSIWLPRSFLLLLTSTYPLLEAYDCTEGIEL
jgi:hypothetical protein